MFIFPASKVVRFDDKEFNFSFASSAWELTKGLAGAKTLDPFDGMLFDFGREMEVIMTPRGMLFPLEVAFIKADGTITEIATLNPYLGMDLPSYEYVRYALETAVGFFERYGIEVGDSFDLGEDQ